VKKVYGYVVLICFFVGALAAWTQLEQRRRFQERIDRLSAEHRVAYFVVKDRQKGPDGRWRTTLEFVGLSPDGDPRPPVTCIVSGLSEYLPPDTAEPRPGTTFDVVFQPHRGFKLVPTESPSSP